jgi:tetratricopeptide (TPR) repeat protein
MAMSATGISSRGCIVIALVSPKERREAHARQARTLLGLTESSFNQALLALAQSQAEQAVAFSRAAGDQHLLRWSLMNLGRACSLSGASLSLAHAACGEAYERLGESNDMRQVTALHMLSSDALFGGEVSRRIDLLRQGLAMAQGPECIFNRCKMLVELSECMAQLDDHTEAVQCMAEALKLAVQAPSHGIQVLELSSRLAKRHCDCALALEREHKTTEANTYWGQAAALLPPLDPRQLQSGDITEFLTLKAQALVLAHLGRRREARQVAAALLRLARSRHIGWRNHSHVREAMAEFYLIQQDPRRVIHYKRHFVATALAIDTPSLATQSLGSLADIHAQLGQWRDAMNCLLKQRARHSLDRMQAAALRNRLTARERAIARSIAANKDNLARTQRLAVIGRLISQLHLSLNGSMLQIQRLSKHTLFESRFEERVERLRELDAAVDSASHMVRQLRLFSHPAYNSRMVVNPCDVLRDACEALSLHLQWPKVSLTVCATRRVSALVDAQRLSIYCQVLLIELLSHHPDLRRLSAWSESVDADQITLHIRTHDLQVERMESNSLGLTLCAEIAQEIDGYLDISHQGGEQTYSLYLPATVDQM